MPPAPVDPDRLRALGAALAPWQECARAGAEDVLTHLVEIGDRETQSALDDYLDVVADLLREVEMATSDLAGRLRVAAAAAPAAPAVPSQPTTTAHTSPPTLR